MRSGFEFHTTTNYLGYILVVIFFFPAANFTHGSLLSAGQLCDYAAVLTEWENDQDSQNQCESCNVMTSGNIAIRYLRQYVLLFTSIAAFVVPIVDFR